MITGSFTSGRDSFLELVIQGRKLDASIRLAITDLSRRYLAELKDELRRPKSGKVYGANKGRLSYSLQRRRGTALGRRYDYTALVKNQVATKRYRASAPGEAPASHTGAEVNAVQLKFPSQGKGYSARIFANRRVAYYRHFLEFGTKDRIQKKTGAGRARAGMKGNRNVGRVAPRPVFSPLQAKLETELIARAQRAADLFLTFGG